jgi:formylglycine-generating enzyme required for sulfatase activity
MSHRTWLVLLGLGAAGCVGRPRPSGDDGRPVDDGSPVDGDLDEAREPPEDHGDDDDRAGDPGVDEPADVADEPRPEPARPAPGQWVRIEPGTFEMGSRPGEACHVSDNDVLHEVTLTRAFEIQSTEVTQEQYVEMLGASPASFVEECGPDCPVEMTDWHAAARYCNALSELAELDACYACDGEHCTEALAPTDCAGYRLPTEAEWEYAYRAGTTTPVHAGDLTICGHLDPTLDAIAWFLYNGDGRTHPVAGKQPNAWGLFDMSGNVWEWAADGYVPDLSAIAATDPFTAETAQDIRVLRGGSYNCLPGENRAAHRSGLPSTVTGQNVGFRCARGL